MRRRVESEEFCSLMADFEEIIIPWCEENELSLHRAFEISRETDQEKYKILSGLWSTLQGKTYLRSYFHKRGGVLRKRKDEDGKEK